MPHSYRIFGLDLASDIACPGLLPSELTGDPDVVIRLAEIRRSAQSPAAVGSWRHIVPGLFLAHIDALGSFEVRDGREIRVQPAPGASPDRLRLFLLGACLSNLLHQRRLFVLHCSGIATERGAVLFAGMSGSGKSTMVGAFLQRGYRIIADDMLALRIDARGQVIALPGFPQVKLWADSASALGRSVEGLPRVVPDVEKFIASERERFSADPSPLHAIYDLHFGPTPQPILEPLGNTARFNILLNHTWQKVALKPLGVRQWHFETAARVAALTYAARLTRPPEPLNIAPAMDLVESDMRLDHAVS